MDDSLFDDSQPHPDAQLSPEVGNSLFDDSLFDDSQPHPDIIQDLKNSSLSSLSGLGRGLTAGYGDELSSGLTAALDVATRNSPELEGESLSDKYRRLYNDYLQSQRKYTKETEEKAPEAALAGDIAGSILSPINKLIPSLGAAKAAGLAGRSLNTLKSIGAVAPVALAETVGRSEATTPEELGKELTNAGMLTAALPAGGQVVGELGRAAGTVGKAITPKVLSRAYELGKNKVDTTVIPFLEEAKRKFVGTTNEIVNPLKEKAQTLAKFREKAQAEQMAKAELLINEKQKQLDEIHDFYKQQANTLNQKEKNNLSDNIDKLKNEIDDLKINYKKQSDEFVLKQKDQNKNQYKTIEQNIADESDNLNKSLSDVKKQIQDEYNAIDTDLGNVNFKINTSDKVSNMLENLSHTDLNSSVFKSLKNEFQRYKNDSLPFDQFKLLKAQIQKLADSASTSVAKVGRDALRDFKHTQYDELRKLGEVTPELNDIANRLKNTNERYTGFSIAKDMVDDVKVDPLTKQVLGNESGASLIRSMTNPEAEALIRARRFKEAARRAGLPEQNLSKIEELSNISKVNNEFKPSPLNIDELLEQDPKYLELNQQKKLLEQTPYEKYQASEFIKNDPRVSDLQKQQELIKLQGKEQFPLTPEELQYGKYDKDTLEKQIPDLLERNTPENKASDLIKEESLFSDLSNLIGPDQVVALQKQKNINLLDLDLGRIAQSRIRDGSLTKPGLTKMAIGGIAKPALSVANKLGRASQNEKLKAIYDQYKKIRPKDSLDSVNRTARIIEASSDKQNISPITDSSNEQLFDDAQQLKQHPSKQAQYVGNKLEKAAQGDDVKKAAVNFDLQQRPESRAVMKEHFDWGDFDETEDEKDRDGY